MSKHTSLPHEISVLRTLLRLSRASKMKKGPTLGDLAVRVGVDTAVVRRALFSLARGGLIQRTPAGLRLSLAGLAVAVACGQARPAQRAKPLPRQVHARRARRRAA